MRLKDIKITDLYDLMDELDDIQRDRKFNSQPMAFRVGVRRTRVYLDIVASGFRMMNGGEFEPHNLLLHKTRRHERQ